MMSCVNFGRISEHKLSAILLDKSSTVTFPLEVSPELYVLKIDIASYKSHSQDWRSYWFLLLLLCLLVVVRKYSKRSTKFQGMYLSLKYHVDFLYLIAPHAFIRIV